VSVGIIFLGPCIAMAQLERTQPPPSLTICELVAHPEKYAGQTVRVRGSISKGWTAAPKPIREVSIGEPWASATCPGVLLVVIFPQAVKPQQDFNLEQDEALGRFQKALRERTHIEATFEGRFDSVFAIQDGKRVKIGKGFGRGSRATMGLVLRKVSDLNIRPTRSVDR